MTVHQPPPDTPAPSSQTETFKRDACIFNAERVLDCGSIVTERNGKIIAKTSMLRKPE
ncbi:MAG: hypothetical protein ABI700_03845 [Chloroflexota bacterium]